MSNEDRQGDDMAEHIARSMGEGPLARVEYDERLTMARMMIRFVGELVEWWEERKPMTATKAAAFMFFIEMLQLDKTDEANACVMLELLEGARKATDELKRKDAS